MNDLESPWFFEVIGHCISEIICRWQILSFFLHFSYFLFILLLLCLCFPVNSGTMEWTWLKYSFGGVSLYILFLYQREPVCYNMWSNFRFFCVWLKKVYITCWLVFLWLYGVCVCVCVCVCVLVAQSCPTLWDLMDCGPPGSSVHGILQARTLQWVAISFSKGSSWPRDRTQVSCIAGRCFTVCTTREALIIWYK